MASQLLTFNPAFMRARGGGEPTGTEPQNIYAVNLLSVVEKAPDHQKIYAVNLIAVVEAP